MEQTMRGHYDNIDEELDHPRLNQTPDFTDPAHRKLLSLWTERMRFSESGKKRRDKMGQAAYMHYRCWVNDQAFPFPTDVYDPHFFSTLDTHIAREAGSLSASHTMLRYSPRGKTKKESATKLSLLAAHHLSSQPIRMEMVDMLWSRHVLGTAIMFHGWEYVERMANYVQAEAIPQEIPIIDRVTGMPMVNPMTGMPMTQTHWVPGRRTVSGLKIFRDRARTWHVPWQDFFPDQSVPWVAEGAFAIVRKTRPKSWLRERKAAGGWHNENLIRALKNGCSDAYGNHLEGLMETLDWQSRVGFESRRQWEVENRQWFEVMECWTPTSLTIIINRAYVVLHTSMIFRHGELPFSHIKNHIIPGEFYGMSDYEVVHKLIKNLQVMRNASASEAVMSVFPPIAMPKGEGQDIKELNHRPFALWRGVDPKRAQFMVRPSQGYQIANQEITASRWGIDSTLGSPDGYRGADTDPNQLATALQMSSEGAGTRKGFQVANIEEQFVFTMGRQWANNMAQFQSWPQAVRILDDPSADPTVIYPDELQDLECDVENVATSSMLQIQEQQRIMQMYQMAVQFQEPNADRRELWASMAESISPAFRVRTLRPIEDVTTELAMKAQEQAQANALRAADGRPNPAAQTVGLSPMGTGRPRGEVVEMPGMDVPRPTSPSPSPTNQLAAEIRQAI